MPLTPMSRISAKVILAGRPRAGVPLGRDAELKELKHLPEIRICRTFANLSPRITIHN
jgi:hypothetical protein